VSCYDQLVDDLWAIYFAAGRGVTYVAPDGERRACWDERYRMELELALADRDAVGFAERLVRGAEPSGGFARVRRARRLDLTIEALVANSNSPYHQPFDADAVRTARDRLDAAGYHVAVISPTGSAPA
jgi:hypothetical protein